MFERRHLISALTGIGVRPRYDVFGALAEAYGDASRHYHDQCHVAECLRHLQRYRHLATRTDEIAVALWFHDAVYDTRRVDNEEASAAWAGRYLSEEGADPEVIRRITDMIIATKSHEIAGVDGELMVDIDLEILGAPRATFERYDQAIRQEYAWVPEEQYRIRRRGVLEGFVARDRIYRTPELHGGYEQRARENLARKLRELDDSP